MLKLLAAMAVVLVLVRLRRTRPHCNYAVEKIVFAYDDAPAAAAAAVVSRVLMRYAHSRNCLFEVFVNFEVGKVGERLEWHLGGTTWRLFMFAFEACENREEFETQKEPW